MAKKPPGCAKRTVRIKRKSGKVVAEFTARSGRDCKPRTAAQLKKATPKQAAHRRQFKKAAAACRRARVKPFTKGWGGCMSRAMIREL